MKLPISYKDFAKDPVKGMLFIVLTAIGYLYYDNKVSYTDQIMDIKQQNKELQIKVDRAVVQLKRSDSALAAAVTRLEVLAVLGKIPQGVQK